MTASRLFALIAGAVYTALAVAGLFSTPSSAVRDPSSIYVGFGFSWTLTILHAAIGVGGLAVAAFGARTTARGYTAMVFLAAVALTAYGIPAAIKTDPQELSNIGWGNVAVYGITAIAAVLVMYPGPLRRTPAERDSAGSPAGSR